MSLLSEVGDGLLKSRAPWKLGVAFPELRRGWSEQCLGTGPSIQHESPRRSFCPQENDYLQDCLDAIQQDFVIFNREK